MQCYVTFLCQVNHCSWLCRFTTLYRIQRFVTMTIKSMSLVKPFACPFSLSLLILLLFLLLSLLGEPFPWGFHDWSCVWISHHWPVCYIFIQLHLLSFIHHTDTCCDFVSSSWVHILSSAFCCWTATHILPKFHTHTKQQVRL